APDDDPQATRLQPRRRYELESVHAEGGMGRVWLARDNDLNRVVAVKEIKPDYPNGDGTQAPFPREAPITGRPQHPRLVPVYELVPDGADGGPFYVMRFVSGRTLRRAIADHHRGRTADGPDPLERRRLLSVFVGVCQAVAYAHGQAVVHRDLKPSNVVLGDYGEAVVPGSGLARGSRRGGGRPGGAAGSAPASRRRRGARPPSPRP